MFSKKLKISDITLPVDRDTSIIVPHYFETYKSVLVRNFNQYSEKQLNEYKQKFINRWGDLTLSLLNCSEYSAIYVARYKSKFLQHKNRLDQHIIEQY